MNYLLYTLTFIILSSIQAMAQTTVTLTVTLNDEQVWALTQDWADYNADTNNVPMAKVHWFTMNATNQILRSADRRLNIRKQEQLARIASVWQTLTPAQQSNIIASLPPPPLPPP